MATGLSDEQLLATWNGQEPIPRPGPSYDRQRRRAQPQPAPVEGPGRFSPPALAPVEQPQQAAPAAAPVDPARGLTDAELMAGAKPAEINQLEDIAKSAVGGLGRGVTGLVGLPGTLEQLGRMGLNKGAKLLGAPDDLVSNRPVLPNGHFYQDLAEKAIGTKFYEPKTTAGQYVNTIAEFAPNMLFPAGSTAARVAGNWLAPAVASEAAGQATKGTDLEPWARFAGALAGSKLPGLPGKAYTPVATTPERAAAVRTLNNEGVTALTAGEVTGARPLRWAEQHSTDIVGGGTTVAEKSNKAAEQFTAAALRRAGIDAPRATTKVMDNAFKTIGDKYEALADASSARIGPGDMTRLEDAVKRYAEVTPASQRVDLAANMAKDLEAAGAAEFAQNGGRLTGKQYARYRSVFSRLERNASDPAQAEAIRDIIAVMDNAVERGLPAQMRGQWSETNRQYRNLLMLAKAATGNAGAASEGLITPVQLFNAERMFNGTNQTARGRGDFADLSRAGMQVLRPLPNSGTPARAAVSAFGASLAAIPIGIATGNLPMAAAGTATAFGPMIGSRLLTSGPVQNYLGANARMAPTPLNGSLGVSGLPVIEQQSQSPPLEVTIYPNGDPRNFR